MAPFVSIVIPTRNRAEKLRVCVQSLLGQDHPAEDYEIIVADDGSRDGTASVVESLGARVALVRPAGRGSNAARNAGAIAARGDPVCFVDDDTEAPPEWLSAMVAGFLKHPTAHAFGGPVRLRVESTRRVCEKHPVVSSFEFGDLDLELPVALGANMAVRRSTAELVGGFDEWIEIGGADTEWFGRLERAGGRTVYLGGAGVWHRRTAKDVRLRPLLWSSFRRGVASHRFFIRIGSRQVWRQSARLAPKLARAGVRERCRGQLAHAALQAGFAYGLLRHRRMQAPPAPAIVGWGP